MKMNPVVHFELPAKDRNRMADFYTKAFGWKTQMLGEEMGHYITVETGETDQHKMPLKSGFINGGFYTKTPEMPEQHPSVIISVDDINEAIRQVKSAGGTVHGEAMDIPGISAYVSFTDTEGNRLSMLKPVMR